MLQIRNARFEFWILKIGICLEIRILDLGFPCKARFPDSLFLFCFDCPRRERQTKLSRRGLSCQKTFHTGHQDILAKPRTYFAASRTAPHSLRSADSGSATRNRNTVVRVKIRSQNLLSAKQVRGSLKIQSLRSLFSRKKPLLSGKSPIKTRVFYRLLRFLPLFIILYVLLYAWLKTSQETFYIVDIDAFRFFAHKKVSAVSAGIG